MTAERETEVINRLRGKGWVRPLDIGGGNGTHHSATLARLVKKGLVERKPRLPFYYGGRGSWLYRVTTPSPASGASEEE